MVDCGWGLFGWFVLPMNTKEWIEKLSQDNDTPVRARLRAAVQPSGILHSLDVSVDRLVERLKQPALPSGSFLWLQLSPGLRSQIDKQLQKGGGWISNGTARDMVEELNMVLCHRQLWLEKAFKKTPLRKSTQRLCRIAADLRSRGVANRAVLEDVFPDCFDQRDSHVLLEEDVTLEKKAQTALQSELEATWLHLLLRWDFQSLLDREGPEAALDFCRQKHNIRLPGCFEIRTWCELRAKTPVGRKLLSLLVSPRYLVQRKSTVVDVEEDSPEETIKPSKEARSGAVRGEKIRRRFPSPLWRFHFVQRELRRGQIGALFLSYFGDLNVSRLSLIRSFEFSPQALQAVAEIGRLINEDASQCFAEITRSKKKDVGQRLAVKPKRIIRRGSGRTPVDGVLLKRADYFSRALKNPRFKASDLIKGVSECRDTERKRADEMIALAKRTREVLRGP
jgi:hypothetical protein